MHKKPKVSVVTITFNHESFISRALESIVKQKTNFDIEVIVADDCSTDKTKSIIQDYAKKYPDVIKPILRDKNIGPQRNFNDAIKKAQGKYIALCEGDDYWTDKNKLQEQVTFLEAHNDFTVCFHPVKVVHEDKSHPDETYPDRNSDFTLEKLVEYNFIQTNSVMYRAMNYSGLPNDVLPLDWYLHLLHAKNGKIGFINKPMSVYRKHREGIWWTDESVEAEYKFLQKNFILHQKFYERSSAMLGNEEYSRQMQHQALALFERVIRLDPDRRQVLLTDIINRDPNAFSFAMQGVSSLISKLYKQNYDNSQLILQQNESIKRLQATANNLLNSRTYKLGEGLLKPVYVIKQLIKKK